jgi:DNA repair protein RecO (recombination protein O)
MTSGLEALVVGGVDYGDADRIVHLLTRNGTLAVFAHGAKKSRRRFQGALEPFTTVRATLAERRRSGMPTLLDATVERSRLEIRTSLDRIALASYVVEVSKRVALEGEPSEAIFELARDVLDHLSSSDASIAVRRAFELVLIDIIGYRPTLDACAGCGRAPAPYVDFNRGGAFCDEHRRAPRDGAAVEIGPNTMRWMVAMLEGRAFDPIGEFGPAWADLAARKLTGPASDFFAKLFDRPLASVALLDAESL